MTSKAVVFWTNIPSPHSIGPFRELAKTHKVYCVCREIMSKFRSAMWKAPDFGNLDVSFLKEQPDRDKFMDEFLAKTTDAAHFVSGFGDLPEMKAFWKKAPRFNIRPIAIAERPNPQRNICKAILRDAYYTYKMHALNSSMAALLCMGRISVAAYRRYGVPEDKALPYMYTSVLNPPEFASAPTIGKPLRFVFVGRDDKWIKGLDVLLEALKGSDPEKIRVDCIGPSADSWITGAAKDLGLEKVVRCLGSVTNDKVLPMLTQEYDALLLTGRYDGWGMVVSEALLSGLGAIVSDACGSCDVTAASGAGNVVKAGDVASLRAAIQACVEDPGSVLRWKERARAYRDDLRPEKLANYLEETIEYVDRGLSGEKPRAFWLEPRV